jgi:hypothetical protein
MAAGQSDLERDPRVDRAEKQLDRLMAFFPRVEAKASFLFAADVGILGFLFLNIHPADLLLWYITILAALAIGLLGGSVYFVYRCIFPHMEGGSGSLIYFREISRRTELDYVEAFGSRSQDDHRKDLTAQIWRNADILRVKFNSIKIAFICTGVSLLPSTAFLITVTLVHSQMPNLK